MLRSGIPRIEDIEQLLKSQLFADHVSCSNVFLSRHQARLRRYSRRWGRDPMQLWSRRWEYPFVAHAILEYSANRRIQLLDAGAGVTYLPFYLCERSPDIHVTCCDSNAAYAETISTLASADQLSQRISGDVADLRRLGYSANSFDAVCCVSVLEHTDRYVQILHEFARVLRPGGLLALTFDLSLDRKFRLQPGDARELIDALHEHFDCAITPDDLKPLENKQLLLTTDHARKHAPHLLPFTNRWLLAGYDFLRGYGWTGGFRSVAVMCLTAIKKAIVV